MPERWLFYINCLILTGLILIMSLVSGRLWQNIEDVSRGEGLILRLSTDMLMLRRHEKDFMSRYDALYLQKFDASWDEMLIHSEALFTLLERQQLEIAALEGVLAVADEYYQLFHRIADNYKLLGMSAEKGIRGQMKRRAKRIERWFGALEDVRFSRDFNALQHLASQFEHQKKMSLATPFTELHQQLAVRVGYLPVSLTLRQKLTYELQQYADDFRAIHNGWQIIGLSSDQGLHGEMREMVHQLEDKLVLTRDESVHVFEQYVRQLRYQFFTTLIIFGLLVLLLFVGSCRCLKRGLQNSPRKPFK